MKVALLAINIVSALLMVGAILMQQGRGAELGSGFGRGASGGLFAPSGGASFMSRATAVLATIFFVSALSLTLLQERSGEDDLLEQLGAEELQSDFSSSAADEGDDETPPAISADGAEEERAGQIPE
jgi:preprotein translocase subunit SecG